MVIQPDLGMIVAARQGDKMTECRLVYLSTCLPIYLSVCNEPNLCHDVLLELLN